MSLGAVTSFLEDRFGDQLAAAFIYGSVAAGQAGPVSDIDCFVITTGEVSEERHAQVAIEFASLQQDLGFTPDPHFPIEVFSAAECAAILAGAPLQRLMAAAASGRVDERTCDGDHLEVLRALLDQRLVLHDGAALHHLTTAAHALLAGHDTKPEALMRMIRQAEKPE